jgi:hypothetical protein
VIRCAIAFNGKFRAGKRNGVWRVSDRLIREVDSLLAAMPREERPDVRMIVPAGCPAADPYAAIRVEKMTRAPAKAGQRRLPALARGSLLVNLANLAPVLHSAQDDHAARCAVLPARLFLSLASAHGYRCSRR